MQDSRGFMWFGTKDGLNRYDGYTFKIFRHNQNDSNSIGNNFILSIYEDKNGTVWAGTFNGLYRYNPVMESFVLIKETVNNEIGDVTMDKNGDLWFTSGWLLCQYNLNKNSIKIYPDEHDFRVTCFAPDKQGNLWLGMENGSLKMYNANNKKFDSALTPMLQTNTLAYNIEKIFITPDNKILIGTGNQGLKIFDPENKTAKQVTATNNDGTSIFVRDILQCSNYEYWVASESGILVYNSNTNKITNLKKDYTDPYSLSDNAIYTLCKDKEGNIWAGTYFGGINYFSKQFNVFEKFFPANANTISGNAVREICEDNAGNLWIGTEDAGLNKLDKESGKFIHYKPDGSAGSITYSNIHGLLANDNELWIGTFEHGLDIMNISTGKVITHITTTTRPDFLNNNFIYAICKTRSGNILLTTARGLHLYDSRKKNLTLVTGVPSHIFYTSILEDVNGIIWLGTYRDGLIKYNPTPGQYTHLTTNNLLGNRINGLFECKDKTIWVATENGLTKINAKGEIIKNYTTNDGFPSNIIYSILEDDNQLLWISTSKGLVHFSPASGKVKTYTKSNGLLTDQFNYSSAYKDKHGNMYFGSVNGMVKFNPANLIEKPVTSNIYITGFQIKNKEVAIGTDDKSILKTSITNTEKIILPYNLSTFSIDFAALSFSSPEMTEYAYKMEGLDKDWTLLKTNRKVYFTELAPGNYTFRVKVTNNSGEPPASEKKLSITVLPPFWKSNLAYTIYFLTAVLLIYLMVRNYHLKTKEKTKRNIELLEHEKEKEIYASKIDFFTNIAHEIRTPLTLIKLPLEKIINKNANLPDLRENLLLMEKNTNRLIDLTNQLLDFRKTEANNFSLSFIKINVTSLVQDIYERFKPAAEQKDALFTIYLPSTPLYAYVDAEAFTKIISNLFSNAIKYCNSIISLRLLPFTAESADFTIEVRNDGHLINEEFKEKIFEPFFRLPINKKEPGTGIGLALSRSLAELHKGTLLVKNTADSMNIFLLTLPIHQEKSFDLYPNKNSGPVTVHKTDEKEDGNKPAILLVDDNEDILTFITKELSATYKVMQARNGAEALQVLNEKAIQLIVSDVMMPVMDGFELCRQVKSNFNHSHVPIILLTAKNTLQSKIEGLELGADAYIEKPFSEQHLQVQIANLLNNRNKLSDYFANSPLAHIKSIAHTKADETFLEKVHDTIIKNLENNDFDVEQLAKATNMSKATLHRKIKAVANLTPNELINITRLKKAAELLSDKTLRVYEVAIMVGYSHQSNFARDFQKQFGISPSEYTT
jgi:ligand-binding sensor domain-containing protein/signal transduction histidine kinase/DNA-binding response OmpR family regulator